MKKTELRNLLNKMVTSWYLERIDQLERTDPKLKAARKKTSEISAKKENDRYKKYYIKLETVFADIFYQGTAACYRMGFWDGADTARLFSGRDMKKQLHKWKKP